MYLADGTSVGMFSKVSNYYTGNLSMGSLVYRKTLSTTLQSTDFAAGRIYASTTGTGSDVRYYTRDHLGSTRLITGGDGTVLERSDYYPFGLRMAGGTQATGNRWRFAGKEEQKEGISLDWLNFGARMYDPYLARWTTQDPLAEKYYSISPYAYCAGNPVNLVDLNGNFPQLVGALGGALVGGLVGGGIAFFEGKRDRELWGAVGGGAVSGAIIGATGGAALLGESTMMGIGHSAFTGAVSGVFGSVVEQSVSDGQISAEQVANDGIWGAAAGAITATIKAGMDWVENEVVSGIKQSAKEMESVVRREVKTEFQQSGRTTGYRSMAQIERETANRVKDAVSASETLVKAAAETAKQVQTYWIGWKIDELNQNLYERYRNH